MNISDLTTTHDSAHWYHRDGTRCDEIIGKTTSYPRKPTIRDARELGLLPGVTGICKIYPNSGMGNCSKEILAEASAIGTRRHKLVEDYFAALMDGACMNPSEHCGPDWEYIEPYISWFHNNAGGIINTESIAAAPDYAGTMDLHCWMLNGLCAVVDLKNRKNLATYDTDAMQLAAYRRAVGADVGISVILGTAKPEILVKEWTQAEDELAWTRFSLCLALWKSANGYYPESWKAKECYFQDAP